MKLPITEKFLWDIFSLIQATTSAVDVFSPKTLQGAVSPEIDQLRRKYDRDNSSWRFARLIKYLELNGYIKETETHDGGKAVLLTEKGAEKVLNIKIKTANKNKREDGMWIMVMYDIPDDKKSERESFRYTLKQLGYKMLQKSVWVCSRDVYEETKGVVKVYGLKNRVKVFLVEEVIM
ncbi:MAG: CRISPR-associated endonuclease Cas2 [Candidatus Spechtbacterales bacterium]